MTLFETIVVVTAIVAATIASVLGHLTPELGALLGVAVGYGAKGAITSGSLAPVTLRGEAPWKGADDE